jgi:hypothetical protein
MDKKQAFCCLNCTNLPPCNAAAGNCVPCCADCGDTSNCRSTAYFGKQGGIYKGYISTSSSSPPQGEWVFGEYSIGGGTTTYNSITQKVTATGFSKFITIQCGPCYCGSSSESNPSEIAYQETITNCSGEICTTTFISKGICIDDCEECSSEFCFGCGCTCERVFSSTSISTPSNFFARDVTGPACDASGPNSCQNDGACIVPEYTDLTINFIEPLKTYNSLGEIVGDPTPDTEYNPCSPIRIATAPGCHFFAP